MAKPVIIPEGPYTLWTSPIPAAKPLSPEQQRRIEEILKTLPRFVPKPNETFRRAPITQAILDEPLG